jgi:hypothetical protein
MIRININNKEYSLPEELDIETFTKIYKLGVDNDFNYEKIIGLVFNIDPRELEGANEESIQLIMGFIISILNNRYEAPIMDLEKMSFGEFVDLEVYLSFNYINHMSDMMKILSPYTKTGNKAMYVIEKWLEWRAHVYRQYKGLFDLDQEPEEDIRPRVKNKFEVAKAWYKIIVDLSGDDILKMEAIENQPFKKVLNFMSYRKEQIKIQELEMKKRERQAQLNNRRR